MREKYESLSAGELREVAKARGLKGISALRKDELVQRMLEEDAKEQEKQIEDKKAEFGQLDSGIEANGILEVLADGYGFIRSDNYMPGENDVYVSPSQIRRFNLKTGDIVRGSTRVRKENEKFGALLYVTSINGMSPNENTKRYSFEDMTPIFPDSRLRLERPGGSMAMRIVDLISPIGKGQRGMIVSPPKAGKTTLLKEAASLTILATALVDTGSKMDDVVYEEFKGTGNMELVLDRKLQEKRVFPAIDIAKSGTRREDLLLSQDEQEAVYIMRKALNGMKADEAVENILNMFTKTRNNQELVNQVKNQKFI